MKALFKFLVLPFFVIGIIWEFIALSFDGGREWMQVIMGNTFGIQMEYELEEEEENE